MFDSCLCFGKVLLCLFIIRYIYVGAIPLLKRFAVVGEVLFCAGGFVLRGAVGVGVCVFAIYWV